MRVRSTRLDQRVLRILTATYVEKSNLVDALIPGTPLRENLMAELRMERTRNLPQLCKHLGTVRRLAYIFETNLLPDVIAKTQSNSRMVVRLFSVDSFNRMRRWKVEFRLVNNELYRVYRANQRWIRNAKRVGSRRNPTKLKR